MYLPKNVIVQMKSRGESFLVHRDFSDWGLLFLRSDLYPVAWRGPERGKSDEEEEEEEDGGGHRLIMRMIKMDMWK